LIPAIVLGVVLVVSVTASVVRSRRRRNRDLILRHERAISILRDIYEHPLEGSEHDAAPPAARARAVVPAIAREPDEPRHNSPAIEPDTASRSDAAVSAVSALATPMERGSRATSGAARYRRRIVLAVMVAVAAVIVAAVVGVASNGSNGHRLAATTVPPRAASATGSTTRPTSTTVKATPTTPPTPTSYAVIDRNGRPTVVVHTPFALTIAASAPCWTQVRSASGTTLFTGTIAAGQSQTVPVPGNATLTLGNTHAATVTVDGTAIDTSMLSSTSSLDLSST
jgi:hypothetical protein